MTLLQKPRKNVAMTIPYLVKRADAKRVAISAADGPDVTYGNLAALIASWQRSLNDAGLGRGDRIAIVLPNGAHMAVAFIAISASAVAAPLNPAYREDEFRNSMSDFSVKALLVETGSTSPAIAAAQALGIPLIEIAPDFSCLASLQGTARSGGTNGHDEVALVLHTSGTTSRPKIVPLTQGNLVASANSIAKTLFLTEVDRCLNIMPLFHIHGLVAAVVATIASGGSVYCTGGFNALKFFSQLEAAKPSWYTVVPTMHQIILSRADKNAGIITANPLRFIRSSSASLPISVFTQLEQAFGCPVIEAYAMTENAHQMTSNQLPPGKRKPGLVGCAAGPEVAIMNIAGKLLDLGEEGEIVTRGANVTKGYENNPAANATGFAHGWFHTGDQGYMDEDGYLKITGRLKEIINRGGEKVAPAEVDEVLLEHGAVFQAVTFAMPHEKLGEDVAAAVVLKPDQTATERELQDFVNVRLAAFKVPRTIIFLDEIPKGATGKLQRVGLAQKLGLA